jgi:serine/threonine protein kinase
LQLLLNQILVILLRRAPECFNDALGDITLKSDMYSFGILLWEIMTQTRPWAGLTEFQVMDQQVIVGRRHDDLGVQGDLGCLLGSFR